MPAENMEWDRWPDTYLDKKDCRIFMCGCLYQPVVLSSSLRSMSSVGGSKSDILTSCL